MGIEQALKLIKQIGLSLLIIGALSVFGFIINQTMGDKWIELVYILRIFREIISLGDMFINTNLMIWILTIGIYLNMSYWTIKGVLFIVEYFKRD